MTGGDDILYLITLRNLEIHLVIGLCCFEVCFGTGLLTNWLAMVPITLKTNSAFHTYTHTHMALRAATVIRQVQRPGLGLLLGLGNP